MFNGKKKVWGVDKAFKKLEAMGIVEYDSEKEKIPLSHLITDKKEKLTTVVSKEQEEKAIEKDKENLDKNDEE